MTVSVTNAIATLVNTLFGQPKYKKCIECETWIYAKDRIKCLDCLYITPRSGTHVEVDTTGTSGTSNAPICPLWHYGLADSDGNF